MRVFRGSKVNPALSIAPASSLLCWIDWLIWARAPGAQSSVRAQWNLYDPQDIRRFDGRELHFVAVTAGEPLLAVDDREVMAQWWQLTYLQAAAKGLALAAAATEFYEHADYQGDRLTLPRNRGYSDLTKVRRGFLGLGGDWNDIIPALRMRGCYSCTLHEHVDWQGGSLTFFADEGIIDIDSLESFGWNDRTSSVETW